MVWSCFRTEGAGLILIPSIKGQHVFVQDMATHHGAAEAETKDVDESWYFKRMVSANAVAASGVQEKLKELQYICDVGCEAMPTSVVKVIELS